MRRLLASALALAAALVLAASAQAADITVTITSDVTAADGQCSLREAVFAARFDMAVQGCPAGAAGADTILLGAGTFDLEPTPGGGSEDGNESGDLDTGPASALRVVGRGAGATVIDALRGDRAFDVFQGASLSLESLTIARGRSAAGSPGGAVRNQGALTVSRSSFEGNAAGDGQDATSAEDRQEPGGAGGAIWSGGPSSPSVLVAESTFSANAGGRGGEGLSTTGGLTTGGAPGGRGGAIAVVAGTADVSASTFAGNRAGNGGPGGIISGGPGRFGPGLGGSGGGLAVSEGGVVTVVNSTFSGNIAGARGEGDNFGGPNSERIGSGGAADLAPGGGSLRITWSSFAGNLRGGPDAPGANGVNGGQVSASILADAAPACAALLPPTLRNVVAPGDSSCPPPRLEGDARLGPLAANGGATPTLLPGPGSAAVDALVGVPCPGTDQRGLPRPRFGGCDAGAVEVQPGEPVAVAPGSAAAGTSPRAARSLSGLRLSPAAFRAAGSGGSVKAARSLLQRRAPIGTTVAYRLDGAARVTFTIRKPAPGRKKGKRCVAPAKAPRGAKSCQRQKLLKGSFAHQGAAGQNAFRFTGRLRRKALAPGPYTLVARLPRPASGRGALATKAFRIVR